MVVATSGVEMVGMMVRMRNRRVFGTMIEISRTLGATAQGGRTILSWNVCVCICFWTIFKVLPLHRNVVACVFYIPFE